MENEFVPYEQSLALKELGFDEQCIGIYTVSNKKLFVVTPSKDESFGYLNAPLYQQAFRWFIENYGKNGILFSDGCQWTFDLRWEDDDYGYPSIQFPKKEVGREMFDTYEEARFECLKKLIEIVKVVGSTN
jgi:hypothetical protein